MSRREWAWVGVAVLCAVGWFARPLSYEALVSVLIGAAISGFLSWYYYQRASNDLKIEAEKLRETTEHAIRMLQTISGGGRAAAITDEQGKTVGVEHYPKPITDSAGVTDSVQTKLESDKE